MNEQNAEQLGTERFEVSYHGGARPSHQIWQGRVYTKQQLESVCGLGTVQGLCGANCYHDYSPFIPGISERTYTDEQLDKMNAEENKKTEYADGKEYTKYEALQRQRKLEITMRAQRQQINLLEEGGADEDDIINARCRYRGTSQEYTAFSKAMGLPQQRERVTVDGLGNIGVGKTKTQGKLAQNETYNISKKITTNTYSVSRKLVNSKEYHDKFHGITDRKSTNESIYQQSKRLLEDRDGTAFERMAVVDAKSGVLITDNLGVGKNSALKTGLSEEQYNLVKMNSNDVVIIHNHPNSTRPSGTDILSMWKEPKVSASIVSGHDGTVYSITNMNRKISLDKIYENAYNEYIDKGYPKEFAKHKATDKLYEIGAFDVRKE